MKVGRNALQGMRYRCPGFILLDYKNGDVTAPRIASALTISASESLEC